MNDFDIFIINTKLFTKRHYCTVGKIIESRNHSVLKPTTEVNWQKQTSQKK